MKILIICNSAAGLLLFREELIRALLQKNNDVAAIVPTTDNNKHLRDEKMLQEIGCNLFHTKIDRRGINPAKDIGLFIDYYKVIRQCRPDLVITYTIKPNIYGGFACKILKIPYAENITGLGTAFEKSKIIKRIVCILYKLSLGKTKVCFFENSENCNTFIRLGLIKKEKTKVLAGAGVDLRKFTYSEYPERTDQVRFLFIGRIMREKGINELLAAMEYLLSEGIDATLDILGEMEEDYTEIFQKYSRAGWLRYHGVQNDVRSFITNTHCFVLPSWHEGMANTNLECAAMGRPIITSNIPGCKEAVLDGVSGFLCQPQNAESLYLSMKHMIEMPNGKRKEMGFAGRKHMETEFDKTKVVNNTIKEMFK